MKRVRIGSGSAWSRDRFEPAYDLVERGDIGYLCYDAMSEVTQSIAQVARIGDSSVPPYDPSLRQRVAPILKQCVERGIKIITNGGWMDPVAAADEVARIGRELGLPKLKVSAVTGSDLTDRVADLGLSFIEDGKPVAGVRDRIVSAEAYLGAEGIIECLKAGADVIVTSRVGDACAYLAALAHEFGWRIDDHHKMARGMIVGHLLECGAQVTGGCFADPGYKDVPDIANLGNPIVEVDENRIVISKLPGTGGVVSEATCKEQLLYEVQNPALYYCPDVIVDMTKVQFRQIGENQVEVSIDNAGKPKTPTLKALVGLLEGYIAEEMVLFAGPGAMARAELTKHLLLERFKKINLKATEIRMDYVGLNAVHRESSPPPPQAEPYEIILRIAIKTESKAEASRLGIEVDPLAVNGVSGIGKWGTFSPGSRIRQIVGLNSVLVPRDEVPFKVHHRGYSA